MNDFKAMSDLVADAEELLAKLRASASPEVRKLRANVESSIDEMKDVFRDRLKRGTDLLSSASGQAAKYAKRNPALTAAAGTVIFLTLLYIAFGGRDDDDH